MSIARSNGKQQIFCDSCPAIFPTAYADKDFALMIADARKADWLIRPAKSSERDRGTSDLFAADPNTAGPASARPERFTHTCTTCATKRAAGGRLI